MSKRTSLSVIGVLLTVLLLAVLASSYAKAGYPTLLERTVESSRSHQFDAIGYTGPWSAQCTTVDDAIGCKVTPQPTLPLSTCDDCNRAGEIVCGKGKVDQSKTKKTAAQAGSTGSGCSGACTDGSLWVVECAKPLPIKPATIVDEPDPAGLEQPVPMLPKE